MNHNVTGSLIISPKATGVHAETSKNKNRLCVIFYCHPQSVDTSNPLSVIRYD